MIPESTISEIRERVDIATVVGDYVRLKKEGASFKGLCPFHNEKTPSFYVHPQRRFFHCFGCSSSGDIFGFLTRIEGIPFPDAVRQLAERAGVEIPSSDPARDQAFRREREKEERLVALTQAAAGFFCEQLETHPWGSMARDEWHARALRDEIASDFRLGYAPREWGLLTRFLTDGGWSLEDAQSVGLIVRKRSGNGYYDRFRHRLMFPITDHQGRVVAFSGRLLAFPEGEESEGTSAKYVNSPEGPLYSKGKLLYGLHEGRVHLRRIGWALLCEGNFDLLALHQAGFGNTVAPMGTALTKAQVKLLKRYADSVVLMFDGDSAGRKAVRAAFDVLATVGMSARVVTLPAGADPDSFLREHGEEQLRKRVENAPGIVEYLIDGAAAEVRGVSEKAHAIASLGKVVVKVDNPVAVRLYVERIAQKFGVRDTEAIRRQLRKGLRARSKLLLSSEKAQENSKKERVELPQVEVEVLGALLDQPQLFLSPEAKKFEELLTSPDLRAIFLTTLQLVDQCEGVDASTLLIRLAGNPACPWLEGRLATQRYSDEGTALEQLRTALPFMKRRWFKSRLGELSQAILDAQRQGNDALAATLRQEHVALLQSVRQTMTKGLER